MKIVYDFIMKKLKPIVIWWGGFHMPFSRKKVTGKHYFATRENINVGDVLLATTNGEFSNLINPEKIKHGGLYVGDILGSGIMYVIEATGKGTILTDLVSFLTTKDLVIGTRMVDVNTGNTLQIQKTSMTYLGRKYDYLFENDDDDVYCFELAARILEEVASVELTQFEVVPGKSTYSYKTFLGDEKFITTFNTKNMKV
tara:strand:- start:2018 stop:2614 length:597 start_codon:yes stop_codon:yes gene_type:complete